MYSPDIRLNFEQRRDMQLVVVVVLVVVSNGLLPPCGGGWCSIQI